MGVMSGQLKDKKLICDGTLVADNGCRTAVNDQKLSIKKVEDYGTKKNSNPLKQS